MPNWITSFADRMSRITRRTAAAPIAMAGPGDVGSTGAQPRLRLADLSIRVKLPLAFAVVTVLSIVSVMIVSLVLTRAAQLKSAEEAFNLSVNARSVQVSTWIKNVDSNLVTMAQGKQTTDALYTLSSTFNDLGEEAKSILQKAYIGGNPNPIGQRELLDRADGNALYNAEHAKFHKTFRALKSEMGLYDVFLINRDGDIIYTVAKEVDFADNVASGVLAKSGLSKVYAEAMAGKAGETYLSDFDRYGPSAGAFAVFMATPIVSDMGKTVGVLAVQLSDSAIAQIVSEGDRIGTSTDIFIVTDQLRALTPSLGANSFAAGNTLKDLAQLTNGFAGKAQTLHNVPLQSGKTGSAKTVLIEKNGAPWLLVAEREDSDILAYFYEQLALQLAVGAAALMVVIGLGIWMSRSFANPIVGLNNVIQEVASGNFDGKIAFADQKDEFGMIAKSLQGMREKLAAGQNLEQSRQAQQIAQAEVVQRLTDALENLSNGDLTHTIDQPFDTHYEVLRGYYNQTVLKIRESMAQIALATEGIRAQSGEISRASEELAHRTEVQAATLEQTAAAMDEMTASVKSAADGVREVETIVTHARKDADECGHVVKEAVSAMSEIEKSSNQISQIIGVIDDIAFQTNLLALNAGVEAARAGDAGRGFAVVASEVGALAQRASTAAKEIKTLISTSSQQVERGVDRVKEAGSALQQIAKRVTHISSLTTNIATGASEQSIGLNEINVGVTQLDQATQKNAAMAEEANAASQLMASGAEDLTQLVARFKLPDQTAPARPNFGTASRGAPSIPAEGATVRKPEALISELPQKNHSPERQALRKIDAANSGASTPSGHNPERALGTPEQAAPRPIAVNARGVWQDF